MTSVSPELLAAIEAAQQRQPNQNLLRQSARVGWNGNDDRHGEWLPHWRARDVIEDMLYWPSPGSPDGLLDRLTDELLTMTGAAVVSRGYRPRAKDRSCVCWPEISRADFTHLLIWLEALGLVIDPAPWVDLVRPAVVKLAKVTGSEIAILWYPRERHRKLTQVSATIDDEPRGRAAPAGKFSQWTTITGYRVQGYHNLAGQLTWMSVVGSRGMPKRVAA